MCRTSKLEQVNLQTCDTHEIICQIVVPIVVVVAGPKRCHCGVPTPIIARSCSVDGNGGDGHFKSTGTDSSGASEKHVWRAAVKASCRSNSRWRD